MLFQHGSRVGRVIALVFVALLLGALVAPNQTQVTAQVPMEQPCLPNDPLQLAALRTKLGEPTPPSGIQRINASLTVEFITTGEITDTAPALPTLAAEAGADQPDERVDVPASTTRFRVFNTQTLNEFRVVMEADAVGQIKECYEQNDLNDGSVPNDVGGNVDVPAAYLPLLVSGAAASRPATTAPITPNGWSNGSDQRVVKNNTKGWPLRTIAQFRGSVSNEDSQCTGTLVGPRHLITAAHCINKEATNTWYATRVTPAKNGAGNSVAVEPYGVSVISTNLPDNVEAWYWTYEEWRDPNQAARTNWDIGIIVIPNRLGNLTGWMGVAARNSTFLQNTNNYNRGYANCNGVGLDRGNRPAGCQIGKMYGDPNDCGATGFKSVDGDGWSRRYDIRCDISAGHSGSPVYHYETNSQGDQVPVVSAVVITESCAVCTPQSDYPSTVRRVTPYVQHNFSVFREIFP